MTTGTVFNIQHFTIHDGPGIRTELFLKGCPLRCPWCSNPEGQERRPVPGVYAVRCLTKETCGWCIGACPAGSGAGEPGGGPLGFEDGRLTSIDYDACTGCMACAEACPADAIKAWGREITVEEAMEEILRDRGYYDRSGGGVTVSGGEALLQADFVAELFEACRGEGIHTCCESTLEVPREAVEKVLPLTDLFISDLKHMDSREHERLTGAPNERILEHQKRLVESGADLILRIPVIPGVNDDPACMEAAADFICEDLGGKVRTLQLLSFMRLGEEKYRSLGRPYGMKELEFDRESFQKQVEETAEYFRGRGIHCAVGTREKESRG